MDHPKDATIKDVETFEEKIETLQNRGIMVGNTKEAFVLSGGDYSDFNKSIGTI